MDFAAECGSLPFGGVVTTRSIAMRVLMTVILGAAALAGCASQPSAYSQQKAASESARLEVALKGKVAGKAESCISTRNISGPESFGETTLLFRASRNLIYRTETSGSCRDVGNGRALITRLYGSDRLCKGDISRTADLTAGFETGGCAMGDFVPYRPAS
jgi:hypothetical protein